MITITVAYNNIAQKPGLKSDWGFAAHIQCPSWTVLFDTGGDGDILLRNLETIGAPPSSVEIVVLSHPHRDHTGGLEDFLNVTGPLPLVLPVDFSNGFHRAVQKDGRRVTVTDRPAQILPGLLTTGRMGSDIPEQGLILRSDHGPILITGCAHPGIVALAERTAGVTGAPPWMIIGGFHLLNHGDDEIQDVIRKLKDLGVKKAAPSHCTGFKAMERFQKEWGDGFISLGLGGSFQAPMKRPD